MSIELVRQKIVELQGTESGHAMEAVREAAGLLAYECGALDVDNTRIAIVALMDAIAAHGQCDIFFHVAESRG